MGSKFIDFAALKEAVSLTDAISLLDLEMKRAGNQWRGHCPACGSDDDRALVITDGKGWFCHAAGGGGDVISLAKHILELPTMRDAAFELAERAGTGGTSKQYGTSTAKTVPESERAVSTRRTRGGGKSTPPPQPKKGFDPDEYAAKLDYEHELLIEAGADLEKMRELGIGYSARGTHRGMIVIRVGDDFIGIEGTIHLPASLKSNVVPLKRRA